MPSREEAIKTVKNFIKSCEESNITFNRVIMFGSTINGHINEESDIDLLLVSDKFGYSKWENAKLIASVNKKFTSIEAHTFPTEYFLAGDPFINEVKRTGIEIN